VLGISPEATDEQIKRAYHKLAFEYHPDRHQASGEAHKKMEEINEAYAVLSEPAKRREYDLPRGYGRRMPKFKRGGKVKVAVNSLSQYRGHTGIVDKEPASDAFRFWYMVRIESKGFAAIRRFPEEELEASTD